MALATRNVFVLSGGNPGLIVRGNIDIYHRAVAHLPNGKIATVNTASWHLNPDEERRFGVKSHKHPHGVEILIPQVINGKVVGARQSLDYAMRTKQHLGIFDTPQHATQYAIRLHQQQAKFYAGR